MSRVKLYLSVIVGAAGVVIGCMSDINQDLDGASEVFSMTESGAQRVGEITDFKSAESYSKKMGYYDEARCHTYLRGGEPLWYSGSYGNGGEAGQGYGSVVKRSVAGRDMFLFQQKGITTAQAMLPPGLSAMSGESRWDLGRYQRLLADIAFGRNSINGPQYQKVEGEIIDQLNGGTARGNVSYGQALKLTLTNNQTQTQTIIIFVKNQGPRMMEFRELGSVAGTAKVYIGSSVP